MNYQSKNVCVLANYTDPKRKYYRQVYCIEYKTKQLFKLTVPENVNPECFAAQSLPLNIHEFSNIKKGDIVKLELFVSDDDKFIAVYKPDTMELIGSGVNISELLNKVDNVMLYRAGMGMPLDWQENKIKHYFDLNPTDKLKYVKISNQKVFAPDAQHSFPKILYKKSDGSYVHLYIKEPIKPDWFGMNVSGWVMIENLGNGIKQIVAINGCVKNDTTAKKDNDWKNKENERNNIEEQNDQFQTDLLMEMLCIDHLGEALCTLFGENKYWEDIQEIKYNPSELFRTNYQLYSKYTPVQRLNESFNRTYPDGCDVLELLRCMFFCFGSNIFSESCMNEIERILSSWYDMVRQSDDSLYHIFRMVEQKHTIPTPQSPIDMGFYMDRTTFTSLDSRLVYAVDDFDDPLFPFQYSKISLKEKIESENGKKNYQDINERVQGGRDFNKRFDVSHKEEDDDK